MPKIVISYRRRDSEVFSGRIYDRLTQHYGKHSIFIDIDKIPYGDDFSKFIYRQFKEADVLLVVIGPNWLEIASDGTSRILKVDDWVRIEIETALRQKVRIIPLLINRAQMPSEADLPESLIDLPKTNALVVDGGADFHPHMNRLINAIDRFLQEQGYEPAQVEHQTLRPRSKILVLRRIGVLLLAMLIGTYFIYAMWNQLILAEIVRNSSLEWFPIVAVIWGAACLGLGGLMYQSRQWSAHGNYHSIKRE